MPIEIKTSDILELTSRIENLAAEFAKQNNIPASGAVYEAVSNVFIESFRKWNTIEPAILATGEFLAHVYRADYLTTRFNGVLFQAAADAYQVARKSYADQPGFLESVKIVSEGAKLKRNQP